MLFFLRKHRCKSVDICLKFNKDVDMVCIKWNGVELKFTLNGTGVCCHKMLI